MATLELNNLDDTRRLGQIIAKAASQQIIPPLLLRGTLGSGKTRLTAEITRHLPGGENAETASPSFTICNLYPTTPPVLHCDLYRCHGQAPDDIWDFMDESHGLIIIEWAEFMNPVPAEYLDIYINMNDNERLATLHGVGLAGVKIEKFVEELWRIPETNPQE